MSETTERREKISTCVARGVLHPIERVAEEKRTTPARSCVLLGDAARALSSAVA